jgi:hypothetical protein
MGWETAYSMMITHLRRQVLDEKGGAQPEDAPQGRECQGLAGGLAQPGHDGGVEGRSLEGSLTG